MDRIIAKRSRSRSPPWRRPEKVTRMSEERSCPRQEKYAGARDDRSRWGQQSSIKEQMRLNQLQEDERMRELVAQEDNFVLKQRKKKANIRVKEGRAQPIDRLIAVLHAIDPTRDHLDDELDDEDRDIVEPDSVLEGLPLTELTELRSDIETFLHLETVSSNRNYWRALLSVCQDYIEKRGNQNPEGRAMSSVAADIDNILRLKTFEQLERLENDIKRKLQSTEPIDTDYWEQLLKSLLVWKARSSLRRVYQATVNTQLKKSKVEQANEAVQLATELATSSGFQRSSCSVQPPSSEMNRRSGEHWLDPDTMLHIRSEDKGLEVIEESAFLQILTAHRRKISKTGYIPIKKGAQKKTAAIAPTAKSEATPVPVTSRFAPLPNEDFSQATKALYEKEVARGIGEDEEIFTGEEAVDTKSKPLWAHKHRPRKPRYFNRVQMGYEWNKYNQTHYDHSNPPPKVVNGYKFNIFYPDLIEKTKAPTYKIEREGGRKRGQSFAPAGEEDTCLIRFISGPPYEDIAFRIVDKEWDYSAKRERGFKSSFDKGILQLHFQFKKIYYRK